MSDNLNVSILDTLVTPAPRYLMRLALIEQFTSRLPASIRSFLEIGPGTILKGLIRKINRDLTVHSIRTPEDIEKLPF